MSQEPRISKLFSLNEISRALSSALELDDLLEVMHQQVNRLFDAANFFVALYDPEKETWTKALSVQGGKRLPPSQHGVEEGLSGYIIRSRQAIHLHNLQENAAFHRQQGIEFQGRRAKSWMGVPLIATDRVVGVMAIQSYTDECCYTEEDLTLFSTIGAQAAIAIQNAHQYSQGQRQLEELRQAFEEVRRTEEQLIEAQKMEALGLLAAGVAHDFNNLLTIISLYTEQSLQHLIPSSPLYPDLEEVRQATLRATALIRQLLVFSRRQPIKRQPLNMGRRVASLIKLLRRLTREDIAIKLDLPGDLWPAYADPGGIEQVLINLTMNARDAMPYGGRILLQLANVWVDEESCAGHATAEPGPHVRLSVEDNGVGMETETLERVFEPFFTTKFPGRGTGLGLSVVHNIVERHDGWIEVESAPQKGTRFDIYLPALLDVEQREEAMEAAPPPPGHGQKILLVEDNAPLRRALTQALQDAGYTTLPAASSEEAQALFVQEKGEIDLLLSDVILPDGRGYLLANTLTTGRPHLDILLISGYVEDRDEWEQIEEKGYPLLEKPFSLDQLLREVYGILEKSG